MRPLPGARVMICDAHCRPLAVRAEGRKGRFQATEETGRHAGIGGFQPVRLWPETGRSDVRRVGANDRLQRRVVRAVSQSGEALTRAVSATLS